MCDLRIGLYVFVGLAAIVSVIAYAIDPGDVRCAKCSDREAKERHGF